MSKKAKKGSGRRASNQRRKSFSNPANPSGSTPNTVQLLALTTDGGANREFSIFFDGEFAATDAVDSRITAADLEDLLENLTTIRAGNVACAGGPLPVPIQITFQTDLANRQIPLLRATRGDLQNHAIPIIQDVTPAIRNEWKFEDDDDWDDTGTARDVMEVPSDQTLRVTPGGNWRLTYEGGVNVQVRRHRWVYKLSAYSNEDKLLFTMVTPPLDHTAGPHTDVFQEGGSLGIVHFLPRIAYWRRRGAGEYWL